MSWKSYQDAAERGPVSLLIKILGFICIAGVLIGGVLALFGIAGFVVNPFRQAGRVVNKTIDADNVIYNYEWFKQRHEDIGAIDAKITSAKMAVAHFKKEVGPRDKWHFQDREESARLGSIVLGLTQQRADLAAEYNARSRMVNRSIFKTGDVELPASIPVE